MFAVKPFRNATGNRIITSSSQRLEMRCTAFCILRSMRCLKRTEATPTAAQATRKSLKKISSKTPPCCCTTESEENGSSSCYDVYPGRSNISRPLISLRMMQNIYEKYTEMPSRGAIGCCNNIPDLKKDKLYNLIAMIGH